MEGEPRFVGIDVSKAQVDVAVRPTGQRWVVSYDETGIKELVSQMVDLNQYQGGMCISRVLKTTERTLILQPQISSRPLLDRRRYLTNPVLGLLQLAPQPQTNGTFGE